MGGAYSAYGEKRGVYRVLVGNPEGKRILGKLRRRWEDKIKIDLEEVGCGLIMHDLWWEEELFTKMKPMIFLKRIVSNKFVF
jgi:hypothetical protein